MAKYSTGEVSGARASLHRFGIFCMAGVRTIILDGLPGDGDGMSALRSRACGKTGDHILGCLRLITEIQSDLNVGMGREHA